MDGKVRNEEKRESDTEKQQWFFFVYFFHFLFVYYLGMPCKTCPCSYQLSLVCLCPLFSAVKHRVWTDRTFSPLSSSFLSSTTLNVMFHQVGHLFSYLSAVPSPISSTSSMPCLYPLHTTDSDLCFDQMFFRCETLVKRAWANLRLPKKQFLLALVFLFLSWFFKWWVT
jgi:hypothetical protein